MTDAEYEALVNEAREEARLDRKAKGQRLWHEVRTNFPWFVVGLLFGSLLFWGLR